MNNLNVDSNRTLLYRPIDWLSRRNRLWLIGIIFIMIAMPSFGTVMSLAQEPVSAAEAVKASADSDIVINEVFYLGDNSTTDDWIELKNVGAGAVDVSSWLFCARFSYSFGTLGSLDLLDGDDLMLGPGEIVRLKAWTNLDNTSSDLGLYTSTSFTEPDAMIDFVQWGASGNGREGVADAKGIWNAGDFAPTAGPGQSLAYAGSNGGGGFLTLSSDFINTEPSPGAENINLQVSKQADPSIVQPGGRVTYTLTVVSSGALSNTNTVLTDTIPLSVAFITASTGITPDNDDVLTWDLDDLLPNATISHTFVVSANAPTGTTIINDDYGVRSDQFSAQGDAVSVTVSEESFSIYLPLIFKEFLPDSGDEHAADIIDYLFE